MNASATIFITDISSRSRFGVKGAAALNWLLSNGLKTPDKPNTWLIDQGVLMMRLGASEFLIEAEEENACLSQFDQAFPSEITHLHQVPRYDAAWLIQGPEAMDLLAELCLLDLKTETKANQLCMTQVAGVNAIVLWRAHNDAPQYYLLCDGSYHHYMRDTLSRIASITG